MNPELIFNLAILVVAAFCAFYFTIKLIAFAKARPDALAMLSLLAIIFGTFLLVEPALLKTSLITIALGLTFLMLAALNYRQTGGRK